MPARNWRDAFEDLLFAARSRFDEVSSQLSAINHHLQECYKLQAKCEALYKSALQNKSHRTVQDLRDKLRPSLKRDAESLISDAQRLKARYEAQKDLPASILKPRGQWIASLVNSGVLPEWKWNVWNSTDGPVMGFNKRDAPPELDASLSVSELELQQRFEQGQPYKFGTPTALPETQVKALMEGTRDPELLDLPNDPLRKFGPSKSSTVAQSAQTEQLADGTSVTKEFVQEPGALLEEIENAQKSMFNMRLGLESMSESPLTRSMQAVAELNTEEAIDTLKHS
ncbi:MAG: hypothetical protein Q9181_008369 [Wetmoreana brouardii]